MDFDSILKSIGNWVFYGTLVGLGLVFLLVFTGYGMYTAETMIVCMAVGAMVGAAKEAINE